MDADLRLDQYFRAKVRLVEVLREVSDDLHIQVDAVVIDAGRATADSEANHVIKLITNHREQVVSIRHDVFVSDEDQFAAMAAPLLAEAVRKLAS